MKSIFHIIFMFLVACSFFLGCEHGQANKYSLLDWPDTARVDTPLLNFPPKARPLLASDIQITKELLYDRYTLKDTYSYKDTVRSFKWETIRKCIAFVENLLADSLQLGVFKNYKNLNSEAPLVKQFVRNVYGRVADTLGVERYQSVPLYHPSDEETPVRYGRDGSIVNILGEDSVFYRVAPITIEGEWLVPRRYIKRLKYPTHFLHLVFVDRRDQNIVSLERESRGHWKVRSMNPATTGLHRPPYAQETPLGMFLLQQKKERMVFLKDGSSAVGGYAPYASRFTNGAYIHGVPVNAPRTSMIEYSWSLGTIPRSHMCVRNATSHAKFIYDWAPVEATLVVVIE